MQNSIFRFLVRGLPLLLLFSCEGGNREYIDPPPSPPPGQISQSDTVQMSVLPEFPFPYDLKNPDTLFHLPWELEEISGLTWDDERNEILALQDEIGTIFYLNPETGEIRQSIELGVYGDFEGIELIEGAIWMMKSDGSMLKVMPGSGNIGEVIEIDSPFSRDDELEGMGWDANHQKILLAAKDTDEPIRKGEKYIYAFDPETMQLEEEPWITISARELGKLVGKKKGKFRPSAIALTPDGKQIYMLSAQGKPRLLILDAETKEILHYIPFINFEAFKQPEGICFDPEGNLYISNEGVDSKANLMRFSPI